MKREGDEGDSTNFTQNQCEPEGERLRLPYCWICAWPDVDGFCRWCIRRANPGFDLVGSVYLRG